MPKVLVAEDDPRVMSIVRQRLRIEGFGVLEAQDLQEAWRTLTEEGAEAAIVDLTLRSEADGWRLITTLRDDGRFARLPVVIMTAKPRSEVEERAATMRCEYLGKPFDPDDLIGVLRKAMGGVFRRVRVTIILSAHRIEGSVSLTAEHSRFSDAWEVLIGDGRSFIPVTGATLTRPDGSSPVEVPFLQVKKADILAVYPVEPT